MHNSNLFEKIVRNYNNDNRTDASKQIKSYGVRNFVLDVIVNRYELKQSLKDSLIIAAFN